MASAAAAAILAVGAATVLILGTGRGERGGDVVVPPIPPATEATTDTATSIEAPTLWTEAHLATSGDVTLAWNADGIWRYSEGAWTRFADAPPGAFDLAYTAEALWAIAESGVSYLDPEGWHPFDEAPPDTYRIAGDPVADVLWLSTGEDLYRWDGTSMSMAGHLPNGNGPVGADIGYVGDIVVTGDGSVWASGLFGWMPWTAGMARYDTRTGAWEAVRPLGGTDDIPATEMAPTPDGDLWVVLADWFEDWEARAAANEPVAVLSLARYVEEAGQWLVFEYPSEGYPGAIASGGDSIWLTRGASVAGGTPLPGVAYFDGERWATYLEDLPVDDTVAALTVAADGTIWYSGNGEIRQLVP